MEVRRDIADPFSRLVGEYVQARDRALPDPLDVIDGLREIIAVNRRARQQYEKERAGSGAD